MRRGPSESAQTVVLEAYGARLAVSAPDGAPMHAILDGLPRGWAVADSGVRSDDVQWRFALLADGDGYRIRDDQGREQPCVDVELAGALLRTQMRRFVGYHTDEFVFVHAGVVAYRGAGIVLPGRSFAGKSTLVRALVDAGAEFYSDEYAMFQRDGRVAHYREPLSIRGPEGQEEHDIGSPDPLEVVSVSLVALAVFRPGAAWAPSTLTTAAGIVAAMEHAIPARDRPAETLATLSRAFSGAVILQGERGEADETARALLDGVKASSAP